MGRRRSCTGSARYPLSGWRGTDARFPLRYTPRRISVALPPRDPIGVRPHASVIASNRSRKGIYVLCPPGTCAFLGAFLCAQRIERLRRVFRHVSRVDKSSVTARANDVRALWYAACSSPVQPRRDISENSQAVVSLLATRGTLAQFSRAVHRLQSPRMVSRCSPPVPISLAIPRTDRYPPPP